MRSASVILDRIYQIEMGDGANIHYFSDFQKSTFDAINSPLDEKHQYFFHQVTAIDQGNIHVDSLYLRNPFFNLGESNAIVFLITNSGNQQKKEVGLRLLNDDKLLGTQRVEIPANTTQEVSFDIDLKNLTSSNVALNIQDYPVVFDNNFLLAIPNFEKVRVAHINYEQNSYIPSVFANSDLFYFRSYSPETVDFSAMSSFDLVVLEGVREIPSWISSSQQYDVVVIPATEEVDLTSYSTFFNLSFNPVETREAFPLRIVNAEHPFYAEFLGDIPENVLMPSARPSISHRPGVNTLIANEFGEPYLSVFPVANNTYLLTSPLKVERTNLPEHAIFLPLMYRIAQRSMQNIGLISNRFDDALVEIEVTTGSRDPIKLDNGSFELIPGHYFQKEKLIIELPPEGLSNDFYTILQNEDTLGVMAFNVPSNESILDSFGPEELEAIIDLEANDNVRILSMGKNDSYEAGLAFQYKTPYWKYALILALVVSLVEVFLLRRSSAKFQS